MWETIGTWCKSEECDDPRRVLRSYTSAGNCLSAHDSRHSTSVHFSGELRIWRVHSRFLSLSHASTVETTAITLKFQETSKNGHHHAKELQDDPDRFALPVVIPFFAIPGVIAIDKIKLVKANTQSDDCGPCEHVGKSCAQLLGPPIQSIQIKELGYEHQAHKEVKSKVKQNEKVKVVIWG